jgi:hypothetical protein
MPRIRPGLLAERHDARGVVERADTGPCVELQTFRRNAAVSIGEHDVAACHDLVCIHVQVDIVGKELQIGAFDRRLIDQMQVIALALELPARPLRQTKRQAGGGRVP